MKTKREASVLCAPPDRLAAVLRGKGVTYMGACAVNARGAWTRVGATWKIDNGDWIVWGPGVRLWGTSAGLAQLASGTSAKPEWHAVGWACAPTPNIVFQVENVALDEGYMKDVRAIVAAADEWVGDAALS